MSEATEREVLELLLSDLKDEGYQVFPRPDKRLVPEFLGDVSPDAIALRDGKNIVIEVVRPSLEARKKLKRMTELMQGNKKWELRVVWMTPDAGPKMPQVQNLETLRKRIAEVRQLAASGHFETAMLLAWAAFEALGRMLLTSKFTRPQTPGRLIEVLAGEGYLTPAEADQLRALAAVRNSFIHGELDVRLAGEELSRFVSLLDTLLEFTLH